MYKRHCAELAGDDKKTKDTTESVVQLLVGHVTDLVLYPLKLVATCQAISGTGATLDAFPELGWLALLAELRTTQQAMRGNSVTFARKVKVEPQLAIDAAPVVVDMPPPAVEVLAEPLQQVVAAAEPEKPIEKSE